MIIPLESIRDLSIGHFPRIVNPRRLDFISVTYAVAGQTERLFCAPHEGWLGSPSGFNRFVSEWCQTLRTAVRDATGHMPGNTPAAQLGVPPSSPAIYALLAVSLLLGGTSLVFFVWKAAPSPTRPPMVAELKPVRVPAQPTFVPAPGWGGPLPTPSDEPARYFGADVPANRRGSAWQFRRHRCDFESAPLHTAAQAGQQDARGPAPDPAVQARSRSFNF